MRTRFTLDAAVPPKRKYGNNPIVLDGETFDSRFEHKRWVELRNMQDLGHITDLRHHVSYSLDAWSPAGPVRIGSYIADMDYRRAGELVIEDVKSPATRREKAYVWKRAHMLAQYGIAITEVVKVRRPKKS